MRFGGALRFAHGSARSPPRRAVESPWTASFSGAGSAIAQEGAIYSADGSKFNIIHKVLTGGINIASFKPSGASRP